MTSPDTEPRQSSTAPEDQPVYVIPLIPGRGETCDWGDCDGEAVSKRWDRANGWLPVCATHKEGS